MRYCPNCRSEFIDGFEMCGNCEVALVDELGPEILEGAEAAAQAVETGQAIIIARGRYDAACEMREALAAHRVPGVIVGDPNSCGPSGACTIFNVAVHPDEIDAARAALMAQHQALLTQNGLPTDDESIVDLDAGGEIECPACLTKFMMPTSGDVECPDCGLFLGSPEAAAE